MSSTRLPYRSRSARLPLSIVVAGVVGVVLAGCGTRMPAPIEDRVVTPRSAQRAPAGAASPPAAARAAPAPAQAEQRASVPSGTHTYTVKRGDTLYLIALDHGLDYRELAGWNNIADVNRIFVGQVLRLAPPGDAPAAVATATATTAGGPDNTNAVTTAPLRTVPPVVAAAANSPATPPAPAEVKPSPAPAPLSPRNSENYKREPKATKEPYSERALRDMQRAPAPAQPPAPASAAASPPPATPATEAASAPAPATNIARADPKLEPKQEGKPQPSAAGEEDDDKLEWVWPATGKLVTGFSDTANLKGIDIAGRTGQPVLASAAGKVVYAGSGLRGYGKLIIIKHNKNYLSAYAHNKDILVKEGQQVTRGQKIAEMGNTDADQVKLHFEIRRLGKPMDPLKYLPPA